MLNKKRLGLRYLFQYRGNLFTIFTGEELLEPTKIYTKGVIPALRSNLVKGFAHITGGGLTENIPRVLPDCTGVTIDASTWDILPVFGWLATVGMSTTEFN